MYEKMNYPTKWRSSTHVKNLKYNAVDVSILFYELIINI